MTDPVLFYSASAALACVLLLGALDKFRDLPGFAAAVSTRSCRPASARRSRCCWPWRKSRRARCC